MKLHYISDTMTNQTYHENMILFYIFASLIVLVFFAIVFALTKMQIRSTKDDNGRGSVSITMAMIVAICAFGIAFGANYVHYQTNVPMDEVTSRDLRSTDNIYLHSVNHQLKVLNQFPMETTKKSTPFSKVQTVILEEPKNDAIIDVLNNPKFQHHIISILAVKEENPHRTTITLQLDRF